MNLYLLRHGKAARNDPNEPRALTPKGKAEVALISEHFKKHHYSIDTLWHSPNTRAFQTAEIFLKINNGTGIVREEKKELKPEGDTREILGEIDRSSAKGLLLVTHLPFVEELASLLAADSPDAKIAFPTAGMAAFER